MSFLWNPKKKQPQIWTYPIFIIIPIILFILIYSYGLRKADEAGTHPVAEKQETF